ncbi:hypothetical protein JNJ66_04610 [Candidatus Saccharibacteria bacterium]|nr:hypothetical protein [Candidatus Saccharibacteria bacterium]
MSHILRRNGVRFGGHFLGAPDVSMVPIRLAERSLSRPIEIVHWFQAWNDGDRQCFSPVWFERIGWRLPLVTWEPWAPGCGVEQPAYRLSDIAGGRYHGYVSRWAAAAAAYGRELYLRPMHEFNGNWYPWCGGVNGNTPDDFIRAWHYLRRVFAEAGAENVRWVWAANADDVPYDNYLESYYPGDAAVDILALDGYSAAEVEGMSWRSFHHLFRQPYERLCRLGGQPVWITETACGLDGGSKLNWVAGMLGALPEMPRIEAICWFDLKKETDWRLTEDAEAARMLRYG